MADEVRGMYEAGPECRAFDAELAAYLEGEERPAVVAHAAACEYCRVVLRDLEQLMTAKGGIELEEPPARVWANIRATLAAEGIIREPGSGWATWLGWLRNPVPVAALAALVVVGAVMLGPLHLLNQGDERARGVSSPIPAAVVTADLSEDAAFKSAAEEVKVLETSYQAQFAYFEPDVKADYQKALASLDHSIQEASNSVRREPGDDLAREYLMTAYTRKAEVLSSALEFSGR